ncbi:MAG: hypothetical protein WDM96_01350 [Lacunisphaera sp.]
MITDFDIIEVKSEPEALLLEGKLDQAVGGPKYNTDFTDDKRFLLVRVNPEEEMPRLRAHALSQGRPFALLRPLRPLRPAAPHARVDAQAVRRAAGRHAAGEDRRRPLPALRRRPRRTLRLAQRGGRGRWTRPSIARASSRRASSSTARAASG